MKSILHFFNISCTNRELGRRGLDENARGISQGRASRCGVSGNRVSHSRASGTGGGASGCSQFGLGEADQGKDSEDELTHRGQTTPKRDH